MAETGYARCEGCGAVAKLFEPPPGEWLFSVEEFRFYLENHEQCREAVPDGKFITMYIEA
jgi:hypothetical protein